jgi:hypothetical protein
MNPFLMMKGAPHALFNSFPFEKILSLKRPKSRFGAIAGGR